MFWCILRGEERMPLLVLIKLYFQKHWTALNIPAHLPRISALNKIGCTFHHIITQFPSELMGLGMAQMDLIPRVIATF